MCKGCDDHPVRSSHAKPTPAPAEFVTTKIPQGFEATINIRLLPGHDIHLTPENLGCQPRMGAQRTNGDPLVLPESLPAKFKEANKRVAEWLAADQENAHLFLAHPVSALLKAGIELDRTEQKALERSHAATQEGNVVPPGVTISKINVSGHRRGRVGDLKPKPNTPDQPTSGCC